MADTLPERMTRYLNRHIAWLRESLEALKSLGGDLDPSFLERLVLEEQRRQAVGEQLSHEQRALLKEWQGGAGVNEAEREAVRALAREADLLARDLQKAYKGAAIGMARRMIDCQQAIHALRRGRDMLGKYRPGGWDKPGFVDRKA